MFPIPRIVIAGTHSGAGKTTITTALIAAFSRRGLCVQPFKVGPDFIDPGFHEAASGRHCHNLDGWMLSREANLAVFQRACESADLAIIEGVMGLFDGRGACTEEGSTAELAKWLQAPVVLVVDASAMARSAAAVVHGFESFDPAVEIGGTLFNFVGGVKHAELLRQAVEAGCRAVPFGFLPRQESIALPSRNLGLTMAREALTAQCLEEMISWVEAHVDLDALLGMARERVRLLEVAVPEPRPRSERVRIAVARDAAFCFYYRANLELLGASGAELVEFSPIADRALPPGIGGVYLGGGYPELHAEVLSGNVSMLQSIRDFAVAGGPIYAECGGFMYLTEAIVDANGREHAMAGLFPTKARMQSRLAALGYVEVSHGPYSLRGHEFRYSNIDPMPAEIARVYGGSGEGYRVDSVVGSYVHLHFLSCPEFAEGFVRQCGCWQKANRR